MKTILTQYEQSVVLLRKRVEALRQKMKCADLTALEVQALEARRRLLSEEIFELERSMKTIALYAAAEQAEKAGDFQCA